MPGGFHDSENVEYMRNNGIHAFFGAIGGAGQGQYQRVFNLTAYASGEHAVVGAVLPVAADGLLNAPDFSVQHRAQRFGRHTCTLS